MALRALARDEVDNPHDDFRQPFPVFPPQIFKCMHLHLRLCSNICQ